MMKAIDELSEHNQIVIKPAYKGGAIVIQNLSDYKTEAYRQLYNSYFYRKLKAEPSRDFQTKIANSAHPNALKNECQSH